MPDLTTHPNNLDKRRRQCTAIIETPKGHRNKFKYDPQSNLFRLGGILPEGMVFPFDFGFIPSTRGGDGDPLDVLVLMEEPAHVGCLLDIRLIGVIEARQSNGHRSERNDRLLAIPINSYAVDQPWSIRDLSNSLVDQIEQFFVSYNRVRGKKFTPKSRGGPQRAIALVQQAITQFEEKGA